jgi:hypothetical protein
MRAEGSRELKGESMGRGSAKSIAVGVALVVLGVVAPARWGSAVIGVKLAADAANVAVFVHAVDIRGDIAVVGAPNDETGGVRAGVAHVFRRLQGGGWTQTAQLVASDGGSGERFGDVVAIDGDTIVVGAEFAHTPAGMVGAAYVFARVPGEADTWQELAKLAPEAGEPDETTDFGYSASVDADVVVVSALGIVESEYVGRAHIYARDEGGAGQWGEVACLYPPEPERTFGFAVSLSGDTLFVGARDSDTGGEVHVYERNEGGPDQWGWVMTLPRPAATNPSGDFGESLAVDGDTAVIGAPGVNLGEGEIGAFYVFTREAGQPASWSMVSETLGEQTSQLGERIDLSGDVATVWVRGEDGPCGYPRSCPTVRLYSRDHGGLDRWGLVARVWPYDGADWRFFGTDLAIDGSAVFVGAPKAEPLPGPGSVYAYVCGEGSSDGDVCRGLWMGAPSLGASGRAALVAILVLAAVLLAGLGRAERRSCAALRGD